MFDTIIRNGRVVDGTGKPAFVGDVAIQDGRIAAVGDLNAAQARQVLDAAGKIVTPGFVDIHTHYDGQVTWDHTVDPSFSHGVTTIVMGNCGVGFAPVRKGQEQKLIELMEGVEDIPGSALAEGMKWTWESFPEYLDTLASKQWTMDVAAQVPHGPLRAYVMGERGYRNHDATHEDIAEMARLTAEAVDAGAVGFSTSRYFRHTALDGECVPGTYAAHEELYAIGRALKGKRVVVELISGGKNGLEPFVHNLDKEDVVEPGKRSAIEPSLESELSWMAKLSKENDLPVTVLYAPSINSPQKHKQGLDYIDAANAAGAHIYPQVSMRPVGLISSFQMYHIFIRRPSFMKIAHLPYPQRVAELKKPEVKAAILGESDLPASVDNFTGGTHLFLQEALKDTFPMGDPLDFEPTADRAIMALAKVRGVSVEEEVYDRMIAHDGAAMLFTALNG